MARRRRRRRLTITGVLVLVVAVVGTGIAALAVVYQPSALATMDMPASSAAPTPTAPSTALPPSPSPTPTPSVTLSPVPSPTASRTAPPDRIDRSWPRNPPWDACPAPVWPGELSEGSPGEGRRVLVLGDSLTRESRKTMQGLLRASGWTPTFRCWGSKRLDWGLSQIARAKELDQLPSFVIVALGTNDISWEQPSTTQRRVNAMLDRLGPRRQVLWVDLDVAYSAFSTARARWFNQLIREVARGRNNVTVVPWERYARERKAARFDGIHYGERGYRLRAQALTEALNRRARPLPTVSPSASAAVSAGVTP